MPKRGNGEGSIYKLKNGKWRADLTIGFDPATGRQRRRTKTAATRGAAAKLLKEMQDRYAVLPDLGKPRRLREYLLDWLRTKESAVRPRTLDSYRSTLERHVFPHVGDVLLDDLRTYQLQQLFDRVAERSGRRTANYTRTVLNAALNQALKWQLVIRNPVIGTLKKAENPRQATIWSPAEIRRFLAAAEEHRLYALFYLVLTTGLRIGELLGLRWDDVQEDAILVSVSVSTHRGIAIESQPKSARGRRVVPIDAATRSVLRRHEEQQREELARIGMNPGQRAPRVFTTALGTTVDASNVRKVAKRLQARAGVPPATMHDGRHMHLSMLIAKGVDIRTVSDRAGHADTVLTLRQYAHALEKQRKRAAIPLDELLE
jgi:integrase